MANLLHTKGTRTRIYKTLPSNSVGNDGDIILSQIQGKGVYLCSKVNGRWHVSNKMEELRKIEKTSIKDLKLDRVRIGNTTITKDEYDVSSGDFTLDVVGDIELNVDGGQITIKDDTTTHFVFDCDNTSFKIHDDANELDIFQIAIGAEGATTISTVDAGTTVGHLTLDIDGIIKLDSADTGTGNGIQFLKAGAQFGDITAHHTYSEMRLYENEGASTSDFLSLQCWEHGASKIQTVDTAGTVAHLTLDVDGSIILDPADGKFIAKNNGTEFSSADSAYAGMVIGYTYLQPSGSVSLHALQTSFTVEDSTHKISFVVPPSGNVEIEATAFFDRTSTSDVTIYAGLSDNATYNSVGVTYEYDMGGIKSDDEADDEIITWKWTLTSLTPNNSLTYYIGFKSSDASAAYLNYGTRASHSIAHHPFVIKAMALPATIYDGS